MSYNATSTAATVHGLQTLGGLHIDKTTTLLLGPDHNFWPVFKASPEHRDKAPNPIDRWSTRILTSLAQNLNATPHLPFGGPPYAPFLSWALKSGRCWSSPVGMMVHETMGLMVSFRGALTFDHIFELPEPPNQSPCTTCTAQPCNTACPVGALGPTQYDTNKCHAYLNTTAGQSCLSQGCIARRICPISAKRPDEQSAHHMSYFHR